MGHGPWGGRESDTTEVTKHTHIRYPDQENDIDELVSSDFIQICPLAHLFFFFSFFDQDAIQYHILYLFAMMLISLK